MTEQRAIYKGRKYSLLWKGRTKFGDRAKLAFPDGSKEFWVMLDAIELVEGESSNSPTPVDRGTCSCGLPLRGECPICGAREHGF